MVGLYDDLQDFGYMVSGAPPSESQLNVSGIARIFDYSMSGVSANGTIYTFSFSTSVEESSEIFIAIYPNHSNEEIFITGVHKIPCRLISLAGQVVQQGIFVYRVSIESLHPGIYI